MPRPVDIAHAPTQNRLTVTWDDGVVSVLPLPYLRGWCPCAGCQGHSGHVRYQEPPEPMAAEEIHEMGAYAIAIRFSDGHDSGIFTWDWLRRLAPESPPTGYKRGTFADGKFLA